MLIILMLFLILSSILVLAVKRNRETLFIFGMCMSLAIMLSGILLYIAKKGGISTELQKFFYITTGIKTKIQYMLITLDDLGYIIAIGRYLFPLFLLLLALHYSMVPWIRRNVWLQKATFVLPVLSLLIYYPDIFRFLTYQQPLIQEFIISGTYGWIIMYIILAIALLFYEVYSISMVFFRKQFLLITAFIVSLSLLYFLYCKQDPAQVYQLYSFDFVWKNGIYYMNSILSIPAYLSIVVVNIVFSIVGFSCILKYTSEIFESSREEITLKRKYDAISAGTSTFVHSIKNQLLANRVIFKRIHRIYNEDEVDAEKLQVQIEHLYTQNENALSRIEELYRSVKTSIVHLVPTDIKQIVEESLGLFHQKYSDGVVHVETEPETMVLADKTHLGEAINHLLTNAQESIHGLEDREGTIKLRCYNVRLYTVIEVADNGAGIGKAELKKIWEPFYSKKNSNHNWGMGLYYVRMIVKEHFGSLRIQSNEGEGSTFYILLPKYKE